MIRASDIDKEQIFELQRSRHLADRFVDNISCFFPLVTYHVIDALLHRPLDLVETHIVYFKIVLSLCFELDVFLEVDLLILELSNLFEG